MLTTSSLWRFSVSQAKLVHPYVEKKVVTDLGAGNTLAAQLFLQWGAEKVVAIDKERLRRPEDPRVQIVCKRFSELKKRPREVAFLSWPANNDETVRTLIPHLELAETIIYLGSNIEGTACGRPDLFKLFLQRELLAYEPNLANSLIILGAPRRTRRRPVWEEIAGMDEIRIRRFRSK